MLSIVAPIRIENSFNHQNFTTLICQSFKIANFGAAKIKRFKKSGDYYKPSMQRVELAVHDG